ncbi:MAG: peptidase M15 [Prevotellaceae bacterium]|nr:peptidase M15 [Prevotellaceae bacterium]
MTPISKNFTLEEMISSATAMDNHIDNTPSAEALANLQLLVDKVLQPVRDLYGKPIHVNSGYRSVKLNKEVRGAVNSQHIQGRAADISVGGRVANKALFDLIRGSGIAFDQLIDEYDYRWVHVSYRESGNRGMVLHLK